MPAALGSESVDWRAGLDFAGGDAPDSGATFLSLFGQEQGGVVEAAVRALDWLKYEACLPSSWVCGTPYHRPRGGRPA